MGRCETFGEPTANGSVQIVGSLQLGSLQLATSIQMRQAPIPPAIGTRAPIALQPGSSTFAGTVRRTNVGRLLSGACSRSTFARAEAQGIPVSIGHWMSLVQFSWQG